MSAIVLSKDQRESLEWIGLAVMACILFVFVLLALTVFFAAFLYCALHDKSKQSQVISGAIDLFLMTGFTRLIWFFFGGRSPLLMQNRSGSPQAGKVTQITADSGDQDSAQKSLPNGK